MAFEKANESNPVMERSQAPEPGENPAIYNQVIVYQHSNLFYWWPVWFFGFVFAAVTYFGGHHMAIVPADTKAIKNATVVDKTNEKYEGRDVLVLADKQHHPTIKDAAGTETIEQPHIYVYKHRSLGTLYLIILLLVIFITNVTLRGQWSVIMLVVLSCGSVIFWLAGWWDVIFARLGNMSIYLNMGAYMMISTVLFILWCTNFFFFDRQFYVVFTPGQVRVCLELGQGEMIYDSFGMIVQKQRSDLFRHTLLGFGSGDISISLPKATHPIALHNILNISSVLKRVEKMSREKIVVSDSGTPPTAMTPTPQG
jgi:hypothetical protein